MFQWTSTQDSGGHFWFPKVLIADMNWAVLPSSSKAVFPVLAIHANQNGISFPSEERIAAMAGITQKTAREGLRGLKGFPAYMHCQARTTSQGKRGKQHHLMLPKADTERGKAFPFHRIIIEGGNWSRLLPSAKALYVVMRYFGYFDQDLYQEHEDPDFSFTDDCRSDLFSSRRCDFCNAEYVQLARHAGIHRNKVSSAIDDLVRHHLLKLIREDGDAIYKVYLRPPRFFKASFLNSELKKRRKESNKS